MNRLNSKYLLNCKPQVAKWSLQYPNSLSQAHTHYYTLTLMIPTSITYSEQIQELFISNYTHTCHFNTISIFFKSLRNLISWANMWKKVWKLESFRAVEVQSHVPSNSTLRGKGTHFLHFLQSHTFSVRNAMVHSSSTLPWVYNTKIPRKKRYLQDWNGGYSVSEFNRKRAMFSKELQALHKNLQNCQFIFTRRFTTSYKRFDFLKS